MTFPADFCQLLAGKPDDQRIPSNDLVLTQMKKKKYWKGTDGTFTHSLLVWCNLATCANFMYPGSGGFSPAVQNLSSGALDYWIECNLASCIEFMYPGSARLITTPTEPSSVALEYCRRHFGDKDEEFTRGLFMA
ncbi:hypothetical protein B0H11DRAFT_1905812 [Mycena galericulata]|nr:hypothetical protein B0H11DRAFT_1905812 [Mycena galericulata]